MSPPATSAPPNRLTLLLSLSALFLVVSGVAYWVFQNRPQEKAHAVPVLDAAAARHGCQAQVGRRVPAAQVEHGRRRLGF